MSNPRTSTQSVLSRFIEAELLDGDAITSDTELLISGMLDSLAVMSLVAFVEKAFSISVPFEDVLIENFSTIDTMTAYVEARRAVHG